MMFKSFFLFFSLLIFQTSLWARGSFEFLYGIEEGSVAIQEKATKDKGSIKVNNSKFGFSLEYFFSTHQKITTQAISRTFRYKNSKVEFENNELQELDLKLGWAYALGNFQLGIGAIQKDYYDLSLKNSNIITFNPDVLRALYIDAAFVVSLSNGWFLGLETFYQPSVKSLNRENSVSYQLSQLNLYKQWSSVRLGLNYSTSKFNIETKNFRLERDISGFGIETIFLF